MREAAYQHGRGQPEPGLQAAAAVPEAKGMKVAASIDAMQCVSKN